VAAFTFSACAYIPAEVAVNETSWLTELKDLEFAQLPCFLRMFTHYLPPEIQHSGFPLKATFC
jgi:hypothetical protein